MNALLQTIDPVAAAWGAAGALVYATLQLRARLCGGERDPERAERRRAWGEAIAAPIVGTPTAVALSTATQHLAPWLSPPGVAFAIGLLANPLWPAVRDTLTSAVGGLMIKFGQSITANAEKRP